MDKEKEVKRYHPVWNNKDEAMCESEVGQFVYYSDWQAERTKREEAEKELEECRHYAADWTSHVAKIKELEAKVKELQSWKDQVNLLDSRVDDLVDSPIKHKLIQKYMEVDSLESQMKEQELNFSDFNKLRQELSTANAKIVELEATQISLDDICYRKLNSELEAELSTANKKAEKLVEALEEIKPYFEDRSDCDHNGITFISNEENKLLGVIEQALKEFRGGK